MATKVFEKLSKPWSNQQVISRLVASFAYLTLIGWLLALIVHGEYKSDFARYHLRQSLGLTITAALLSFIPLFGWILNVLVLFIWITSVYSAMAGVKNNIPLLSDMYQQHLDFID